MVIFLNIVWNLFYIANYTLFTISFTLLLYTYLGVGLVLALFNGYLSPAFRFLNFCTKHLTG